MKRVCYIAFPVALLLLLAALAYAPGFTSGPKYDDHPNLKQLEQQAGPLSTAHFIFDGTAGPLGRPIALATFAFQRNHWPDGIEILIKTNVAIHLATGIAVFLLAFGLAQAAGARRARAVALLTTALWLLSPFLAPTQLMVIQRMATLSGFFVFSGLALYVWGRHFYDQSPRVGLGMIVTGIVLGTVLASFSKENGALLPLLILVIEFTLFARSPSRTAPLLRLTLLLLLVFPATALLIYIGMHAPSVLSDSVTRHYTPLQGFAAQPEILWNYIRNLVIPDSTKISPFYDDRNPPTQLLDPGVILSISAWFATVIVAMSVRRKYPVLLFAVLFFLTGHLLESSFFYLELYFPHRNYVPSFGVYFGVATLLMFAGSRIQPRLLAAVSGAYVLVFAGSLFSVTSLWGEPFTAAEIWAYQQPQSPRAVHNLAVMYHVAGDDRTSHRLLDEAQTRDQNVTTLARTLWTCRFPEPRNANAARQLQKVADAARAGVGNINMGDIILNITQRVLTGKCDSLNAAQVLTLIDAILENPYYQARPPVLGKLYNAKYLIAFKEGTLEDQARHVKTMYDATKHVYHAKPLATLLAELGCLKSAVSFLETERRNRQGNPVKRQLERMIIEDHMAWLKEEYRSSSSRDCKELTY